MKLSLQQIIEVARELRPGELSVRLRNGVIDMQRSRGGEYVMRRDQGPDDIAESAARVRDRFVQANERVKRWRAR